MRAMGVRHRAGVPWPRDRGQGLRYGVSAQGNWQYTDASKHLLRSSGNTLRTVHLWVKMKMPRYNGNQGSSFWRTGVRWSERVR